MVAVEAPGSLSTNVEKTAAGPPQEQIVVDCPQGNHVAHIVASEAGAAVVVGPPQQIVVDCPKGFISPK